MRNKETDIKKLLKQSLEDLSFFLNHKWRHSILPVLLLWYQQPPMEKSLPGTTQEINMAKGCVCVCVDFTQRRGADKSVTSKHDAGVLTWNENQQKKIKHKHEEKKKKNNHHDHVTLTERMVVFFTTGRRAHSPHSYLERPWHRCWWRTWS